MAWSESTEAVTSYNSCDDDSNVDTKLFDPLLLQIAVEKNDNDERVCHSLLTALPDNIRVRTLQRSDYGKGFIDLLKQLTVTGDISEEGFHGQFNAMKALEGTYYIVVMEDINTGRLCATGTLLVERKFIHALSKRGHVEDIVVDTLYRGLNIGKLMILLLKCLSAYVGCYKVTLDCAERNVGFYQKCGFSENDISFMSQRF